MGCKPGGQFTASGNDAGGGAGCGGQGRYGAATLCPRALLPAAARWGLAPHRGGPRRDKPLSLKPSISWEAGRGSRPGSARGLSPVILPDTSEWARERRHRGVPRVRRHRDGWGCWWRRPSLTPRGATEPAPRAAPGPRAQQAAPWHLCPSRLAVASPSPANNPSELQLTFPTPADRRDPDFQTTV